MEEPGVQANDGGSLWDDAPAWRGLTVAATGLTAALILVSLISAPEPAVQAPVASVTAPAPQLSTPSTLPSAPALPAPQPALPAPAPVPAAPAPIQAAPPAVASLAPATPAPQTNQPPACNIREDRLNGRAGAGTVTGFLSKQQADDLILVTQANVGGAISPAWAAVPRALVRPDGAPPNRRVILLVPEGTVVKPGDHVVWVTGMRDISLPCNYIPNHIIADSGPLKPATPGANLAAPPADSGADASDTPPQP